MKNLEIDSPEFCKTIREQFQASIGKIVNTWRTPIYPLSLEDIGKTFDEIEQQCRVTGYNELSRIRKEDHLINAICEARGCPPLAKCECGAEKTSGAKRGDPAHSTWCPQSKL